MRPRPDKSQTGCVPEEKEKRADEKKRVGGRRKRRMNERKRLSTKILHEQRTCWAQNDRSILIYVNNLAHQVLFDRDDAKGLVKNHGLFRVYRVDKMDATANRLRTLIDQCFNNDEGRGGFRVQENGGISTEVRAFHYPVKIKVTMDDSHPSIHDNKPLIWVNMVHEF